MAEGNRMRTFIMLVSFLGIFFFMVNSMPSGYLPPDEYIEYDYPGIYDPATLQSYNFSDYDSGVYTFNTQYFDDNSTGAISLGGHDCRISSADYYGVEMLMVEHKQGWWVFGWHGMIAPQGYSGLTYEYVNEFWSDDTNVASFGVRCDHLELTIIVTYNQTQFSSLQEAFENHYVYATVGIGYEETISSNIGIWTLVSALLTFQAPDIHILVNVLLVLPIYSAIAILVFMLIAELIPG